MGADLYKNLTVYFKDKHLTEVRAVRPVLLLAPSAFQGPLRCPCQPA
jgi:hypothetical protein